MRFGHVAEELRQPQHRWYPPLWQGMRMLMAGDPAGAAGFTAMAEEIGALAHSDNAVALTSTQRWVAQRYEGRVRRGRDRASGRPRARIGRHAARVRRRPASAPSGCRRPARGPRPGSQRSRRAVRRRCRPTGAGRRVAAGERPTGRGRRAHRPWRRGRRPLLRTAPLRPPLLHRGHRRRVHGLGQLVPRPPRRDPRAARRRRRARGGGTGRPPPGGSRRRPAAAGTPGAGPDRVAAAGAGGRASMVDEGATWSITFAGSTRSLRDSKGLGDLAVLPVTTGTGGPLPRARRRRRRRRRHRPSRRRAGPARLPAPDPRSAGRRRRGPRRRNDLGRAERAEAELDALVEQLAQAFGLRAGHAGPEPRPSGPARR